MHLSKSGREKINQILSPYIKQKEVQSMKLFIQHGTVSTYAHCINVAKLSYWLNSRLHLNADERSLLVGALLHDFYLYDWHEKRICHKLHGFYHPFFACRNAKRIFGIGEREADIIENHMWPLTLFHWPKSREAAIVCIADKCCSLSETFAAPLSYASARLGRMWVFSGKGTRKAINPFKSCFSHLN